MFEPCWRVFVTRDLFQNLPANALRFCAKTFPYFVTLKNTSFPWRGGMEL